MAGHNVYTTPLANIMAVENALAARTNPSQDDERLLVFLQSAVMQLKGRNSASMQDPPAQDQRNPAPRQHENRVHQSQGYQQGGSRNNLDPEDLRNRLSNREGGAESAYREGPSWMVSPVFQID